GSHRRLTVHNASEPASAEQVGKCAKQRAAGYSVRPELRLRVASVTGSRCSHRGSLTPDPAWQGALSQGEGRGQCWGEVADEAVVVRKFWPVKPGNSVEDKTGTTAGGGSADWARSKALTGCEGRKSLMRKADFETKVDAAFTSCPTGQGSGLRCCGDAVTSAFSERGSRTSPWRQIANALVPGREV